MGENPFIRLGVLFPDGLKESASSVQYFSKAAFTDCAFSLPRKEVIRNSRENFVGALACK